MRKWKTRRINGINYYLSRSGWKKSKYQKNNRNNIVNTQKFKYYRHDDTKEFGKCFEEITFEEYSALGVKGEKVWSEPVDSIIEDHRTEEEKENFRKEFQKDWEKYMSQFKKYKKIN